MAPDFLGDAKKDLGLFVRVGSLGVKIGKIQVEMQNLKKQRGKHFRSIGVALHELYSANDGELDTAQVTEKVSEFIDNLKEIDENIEDCEAEIKELKEEFRQKSGGKEPPVSNDDDEEDDDNDEEAKSPKRKKRR